MNIYVFPVQDFHESCMGLIRHCTNIKVIFDVVKDCFAVIFLMRNDKSANFAVGFENLTLQKEVVGKIFKSYERSITHTFY